MSHICKICHKGFIGYDNAIRHIIEAHGKLKDEAKRYVYHMTPQKERLRKQRIENEKRWQELKRAKYICRHGSYIPGGECYCPICHANHSKSYHVYLNDEEGSHSFTLCRNCYKALTADGPQSVYYKSIYDGNYESNK